MRRSPRRTEPDIFVDLDAIEDRLTRLERSSGVAGAEIGYDEITSNVTVSSVVEATGTLVLTASEYDFDGGLVMVEFFSPQVQPAAGDIVCISLFEGATQIGRFGVVDDGVGGSQGAAPFKASYRGTPSAGPHTYKVTAHRNSADGVITAQAGGTGTYFPAYLRFTKV